MKRIARIASALSLVLALAGAISSPVAGMVARAGLVQFSGSNLAGFGSYYASSTASGYDAAYAFDGSRQTDWRTGVVGNDNDGQSLSFHLPFAQPWELGVSLLVFGMRTEASSCYSVKIQYSNTCSTFPACSWEDAWVNTKVDYQVDPLNIELDEPNTSIFWRLLCVDFVQGGTNRWSVTEFQAYAYADFTLQGDTPTPTITPTPSDTPTPTPQYRIEITSTAGSPMYIERRADFGDVAIFFALLIVAVLLAVLIFIIFWRRPQ